MIDTCKNPSKDCKKLSSKETDLKRIVSNPGEIKDLKDLITDKCKTQFIGRKVHYTICFSLISQKKECSNCMSGRFFPFEYKSNTYILCYSELKKNIENKVRIGIHADVVKKGFFRTTCDISPIDDPYLKSIPVEEHRNKKKQETDLSIGEKVESENNTFIPVEIHGVKKEKDSKSQINDGFTCSLETVFELSKELPISTSSDGLDSLLMCPISPITISDTDETVIEKSCEEKLEKKEKPLKIPFSSIQKITEEDLPKPKRKFKKMVPTLLNKPPANTERLSPKPMDNIPSPSSAFYSNLKIEEEVVKEDEKEKSIRLNKVMVPIKNDTLPKMIEHTIKMCIASTPLEMYTILYRED
jgi:hypothetical protein